MSLFWIHSNESTNGSTTNFSGLSVEQLEERMMLSTVQIFAAGTLGGEQLQLQIDGVAVETFTTGAGANSGNFQSFFFETNDTITADNVRIAFLNDFFDPNTGADSNLVVDAIVVDGVRTETESPGVFSTGTFLNADGIQPGFRQSETLHANGFFQFANANSGTNIGIRARGFEGGEQFNVILNGQVAATFTTTTSFQTFQFNAGSNVSIADLDIEFFGDVFDPGQGIDTNLVVDFVTIDGVRHDTEASTTFSTGTFLNADGIQPGFRQSETLHANGIFSFFDPGQGSQGNGSDNIQIRARGDEGGEQFRVLSNGVLLGEFTTSTQFQTFQINTDDYTPGSNLRIEYFGDVFDPANGIDTNLVVDSVTINGDTRQVEDPSTFGFGTFLNSIGGFAEGFNQSETLHANGFFEVSFSNNNTGVSDVLQILGVADGNFDGVVQGQSVDSFNNGGDFGAVTLTVVDGSNNVQASNFGDNSFQLTNTGNKEVAAVFIDIRDAVFGDQVFDIDGTGGDTVAKTFRVDSAGNTGAFFVGSGNASANAANLFFAGATPNADTSGQGSAISGGDRGLLIRFDGSSGGFDGGETVGFSGDGDPNSIAGFSQAEVGSGNSFGNAITGTFDTGGQSGAELIGSSFTVLFADGTTATGYLGSDATQAGAVGEAIQGREQRTPVVTVNTGSGTFSSDGNSNGQYGGSVPQISVTGQPGDTVRVNLFKGFNPVTTSSGSPDSVADVIQGRLDSSQPQFPVNNAFDVQTVDVFIDGSGTATVPLGAFDYNNTNSGVSFNGDNVQPIAITAAVVVAATDGGVIQGGAVQSQVPLGAVSTPIYLLNPTQNPVS